MLLILCGNMEKINRSLYERMDTVNRFFCEWMDAISSWCERMDTSNKSLGLNRSLREMIETLDRSSYERMDTVNRSLCERIDRYLL